MRYSGKTTWILFVKERVAAPTPLEKHEYTFLNESF